MKSYKAILAGAALLAVPALCSAALVESFESGTLNGWNAQPLHGVTGMVNTDFSSDGSYSYVNTFTVTNNSGGEIIWKDTAGLGITASTTTLTVDVYSDWANSNGWGVWQNTVGLKLNSQVGGWHWLSPSSGGLANGSFQTLTYDLTGLAAGLVDPSNVWSAISFEWGLGTWAGDGGSGGVYTENGTQTFAIDNVQVIPEPATLGLVGFAGAGVMFVRRRFMI